MSAGVKWLLKNTTDVLDIFEMHSFMVNFKLNVITLPQFYLQLEPFQVFEFSNCLVVQSRFSEWGLGTSSGP